MVTHEDIKDSVRDFKQRGCSGAMQTVVRGRGRNASLEVSYYQCQERAMKARSRILLVSVRQAPPNGKVQRGHHRLIGISFGLILRIKKPTILWTRSGL